MNGSDAAGTRAFAVHASSAIDLEIYALGKRLAIRGEDQSHSAHCPGTLEAAPR